MASSRTNAVSGIDCTCADADMGVAASKTRRIKNSLYTGRASVEVYLTLGKHAVIARACIHREKMRPDDIFCVIWLRTPATGYLIENCCRRFGDPITAIKP